MICQDYQNSVTPAGPHGRSTQPVSDDINRLLAPKALEELNGLETQISIKMKSNEPIDVEYWEQLLRSIAVYKAKAELKQVYNSIINDRLAKLRQQQALEAAIAKEKLVMLLTHSGTSLSQAVRNPSLTKSSSSSTPFINYSRSLDPEPLLRLGAGDKGHDVVDEGDFLNKIVCFFKHLKSEISAKTYLVLRKTQNPNIRVCTFTTATVRSIVSFVYWKANRGT